MKLDELKAVAGLCELPVFEAHDPEVAWIIDNERAFEIAEAENPVRACELLHRSEYRAVAAIRFGSGADEQVRVYFERLDDDSPQTNIPSTPPATLPRQPR